jgi:hypothetical protein
MTQVNTNNLWTCSSHRPQVPLAPERAIHFGLTESGRGGGSLKKLPSGFAERVREVKILATPGLDEGLERSDAVIEEWKKSL